MTSATTIALIAGAAISAVGAIQQGKAASDAANFNAQVANNNAISARQGAAEQAKREARLGQKRMGTLRAIDPDKGDLLEDSAIEEELNLQTILHSGELAALGFRNTAALDLARGENAKTASYISASSSLLSATGKSGALDNINFGGTTAGKTAVQRATSSSGVVGRGQ